ncbi:DnaT-like ssDNA-binding protein [Luteimonas sp. WGS1318]|uniref:DnaT-like ssDNA-binding protein n=1 Tax=Luteimonas sp. WGS1318 TaxID=3366815 RepID=UPI00372D0458
MLTIETGTGAGNADSYATRSELQARASGYGGALPADGDALDVLLRRAAAQMDALPWAGQRASHWQALAWPRVEVPGVARDAIPHAIKAAQCALAIELHAADIAPAPRGPVIRERVDVLEVAYAEPAPTAPALAASAVLAAPYLARRSRVEAVRA